MVACSINLALATIKKYIIFLEPLHFTGVLPFGKSRHNATISLAGAATSIIFVAIRVFCRDKSMLAATTHVASRSLSAERLDAVVAEGIS